MITKLRRPIRSLQAVLPRARSGVHLLAYHLVGHGTTSPVDLPFETFRGQMEELADAGIVVSLDDALRRLADDDVDRVLAVLTFDDAFANFADRAFPVLEELGLPSTLYVPTGFLEGEIPGPLAGAEDLPPISWARLHELTATGLLTVGSHTHRHLSLPGLTEREIDDELLRSRELLEDRLERPIPHFCYPRALWSRRVETRVREIYDSAVVAGGRLNTARAFRRHRMSRVPLRRDMPRSLAPILASRLWLEEMLSAGARALRSKLG